MSPFACFLLSYIMDDNANLEDPYSVLAILHQRPDGVWVVLQTVPYYWHDGVDWIPMHNNDVIDYLARGFPRKHFLIGRVVNKELWKQVWETAKTERNLRQGKEDGKKVD